MNSTTFHDFGKFVSLYLLNPFFYGHGTCTIGHNRDQGLKKNHFKHGDIPITFRVVNP